MLIFGIWQNQLRKLLFFFTFCKMVRRSSSLVWSSTYFRNSTASHFTSVVIIFFKRLSWILGFNSSFDFSLVGKWTGPRAGWIPYPTNGLLLGLKGCPCPVPVGLSLAPSRIEGLAWEFPITWNITRRTRPFPHQKNISLGGLRVKWRASWFQLTVLKRPSSGCSLRRRASVVLLF